MAQPRRKCRLVNLEHSNIDLTRFEDDIINTVNEIAPGKNPKVFKEYFSTDPLSKRQSILLGQKLSKINGLKDYGKTITTFRLFDGKVYDSEAAKLPKRRKKESTPKGGRMR